MEVFNVDDITEKLTSQKKKEKKRKKVEFSLIIIIDVNLSS